MNFDSPPLGLSKETYGLLLICISTLFFSIMSCFMKLCSQSGMPSTELAFARSTFQGFFLILFMCRSYHTTPEQVEGGGEEPKKLLIQMPLGKDKEVIPLVLVRGLMGGLNFLLKFHSLMVLPLGDAMTLRAIHPIITVFMARIYLGEEVRHSHVFAAIATATGVILMTGPPTFLLRGSENIADDDMEEEIEEQQVNKHMGYFAAILSSVCAAGALVLIRKAGTLGVYTSQLLFSFSIFAISFALLLGITIGPKVEGTWISPPTARIYWYIFAMCSIGAFAQLLLNHAGRMTPAGLASIATSTSIVWGYVLEIIIFNEIPSWSTVKGVILILIALYTVSYEKIMRDTQRMQTQIQMRALKENSAITSLEEMRYRNMDEFASSNSGICSNPREDIVLAVEKGERV